MKKLLEKREGFTLIELLAVIVILAVIMLVASTSVAGVMKNAKQGTFRNEFLSLLEAASIQANLDQMNGTHFTANSDAVCYDMSKIPQFSKEGYDGSVLVLKNNGTFTYVGWMFSPEFQIASKIQSTVKSDDAHDKGNVDNFKTCGKAVTTTNGVSYITLDAKYENIEKPAGVTQAKIRQ